MLIDFVACEKPDLADLGRMYGSDAVWATIKQYKRAFSRR
ncbi:MAG: hypothetical protein NVS9B15_19480 [Acidobacteriaceae bacterium]